MLTNKVSFTHSQKIYNELYNGKVINRQKYDNKIGMIKDNELYNEILMNEDEYIQFFNMMGLELKNKVEYYYLKSSKKEYKNEQKNKIFAALVVIVRFITHEKDKKFDILIDANYGVNENHFEGLKDNLNYIHILENANLTTENDPCRFLKFLSDKSIMEKNKNDKFILTSAGKSIVNEIRDTFNKVDED